MTAAKSASVTTLSEAPSVWVIGDQVRFMGDVEGANLSVVDVTVMPGSGTPPHRHASPEIFRVTEGEVTFGIFADGPPSMITAGVGTVVTVPSWLGHNYSNQSDKPARFAAVLEHEMVDFFKDIGSDVMPPRVRRLTNSSAGSWLPASGTAFRCSRQRDRASCRHDPS